MKYFIFLIIFTTSSFAEYSMDEKIGQMILVGFRGSNIHNEHQVINDIINYKIGSVILFDYDVKKRSRKRNIISKDQVSKLTNTLQSHSKTPLLITVDQEGGLVQRLKARHGFTKVMAPGDVGKKNDPSFTFKESQKLARDLKSVGINLNFSPSADVNTNPLNPVIGKIRRSYSKNPDKVAMHIREFIKSHRELNVGTTIKHFPGHGSSKSDSHKGFVDVTDTWDELELIPFKTMIDEGRVDIIMSAHIFNGGLDPLYPGTLSKSTITDLLRNHMSYDGVIISDDMNMSAITDHYGFKRSIELSINAGIDILLYGNNLVYEKEIAMKVQSSIKELIAEGKVSESQINESFNRIMALKKKLKLIDEFKMAKTNKTQRSIANKSNILDAKQIKKNKQIFKYIKSMDN